MPYFRDLRFATALVRFAVDLTGEDGLAGSPILGSPTCGREANSLFVEKFRSWS